MKRVVRSTPKGGRPPVEFDLVALENLCRIHATHREIAAFFACSTDTLVNRIKDDPRFAAAMEHGYAHGRMGLRRKQMETALEGNPTMLIWMGKQLLDQRDNLDQRHSGSEGGAIEVDVTSSARQRLADRVARATSRNRDESIS